MVGFCDLVGVGIAPVSKKKNCCWMKELPHFYVFFVNWNTTKRLVNLVLYKQKNSIQTAENSTFAQLFSCTPDTNNQSWIYAYWFFKELLFEADLLDFFSKSQLLKESIHIFVKTFRIRRFRIGCWHLMNKTFDCFLSKNM